MRTVLVLAAAILAGSVWAADDKPREPAKKAGTVVGTVTAKEKNWLEVKADGEEKARRYMARWVGGAPAAGGGPDKKMVETIAKIKVGSRVRLGWEFDERPRVVKVEVLRQPEGEREPQKKGTIIGTLTAKERNWVEIKADGEEKGRRYLVYRGGTKEVLQAIHDAPVGSRVQIDWFFFEHPRVLKLEVLKKAEK
jgi:hypothetical protein